MRGLELSDVDELMKYWNKQDVKRYLLSSGPHAREEELEWIRSTWKRRKEGKSYIFGIITKEKNLFIGNIELEVFSQINRRGIIGIVIFNSQYWDRGYGTESLMLILDFGFKNLNLNSIELEVFETNLRAISCYLKVGFQEVGRRRKAQFFEGNYIDSIIMDILFSEWKKKKFD